MGRSGSSSNRSSAALRLLSSKSFQRLEDVNDKEIPASIPISRLLKPVTFGWAVKKLGREPMVVDHQSAIGKNGSMTVGTRSRASVRSDCSRSQMRPNTNFARPLPSSILFVYPSLHTTTQTVYLSSYNQQYLFALFYSHCLAERVAANSLDVTDINTSFFPFLSWLRRMGPQPLLPYKSSLGLLYLFCLLHQLSLLS